MFEVSERGLDRVSSVHPSRSRRWKHSEAQVNKVITSRPHLAAADTHRRERETETVTERREENNREHFRKLAQSQSPSSVSALGERERERAATSR